jgi:mannose/cellobiose epimerase-like protein (N-acyl-D-glucosamine 2-epimerase family)
LTRRRAAENDLIMPYSWKGTLMTSPTAEGAVAVLPDYEAMLLSILDAILERFERNPNYRFVDTKLSILTGKDHPEAEDPERDFKGKTAIYAWIQGRGLEALAGHAAWVSTVSFLSPSQKENYRRRLMRMVRAVFDQMEEIRGKGNGHLSFLMTPDGRAFDLGPDGKRRYFTLDNECTTFSDLFYAKGMFCAARMLNRPDKAEEACRLFRTIIRDVEHGKCRPDQIAFDPKNNPSPQPCKQEQGWRMISILGFAVFAEALGTEEWFAGGERFIRHGVDRHINFGQWPELELYDFVEVIDATGRPWHTAGTVLCDPGHALELIGLATKFLLVLRDNPSRTPSQEALLTRCREVFPKTFLQAFRNGFNRQVGGLCKGFDLVARAPLNSDMPWWSLPETLRAAAELLILCPDDPNRSELLQVAADCSNAFVKNFVNRSCHLMAYQTVDAQGRPVDVVPATPDADPGYHTGLSIIDFIACVHRLAMPGAAPGSISG